MEPMQASKKATVPTAVIDADWKRDIVKIGILYRGFECGEKFELVNTGTDQEFIDRFLSELHSQDLLEIQGDVYVVTAKGRTALANTVKMYDQAIKFRIFQAVDLTRELTVDESDSSNPLMVVNNKYDPRFAKTPICEDLRIAMLTFVGEQMAGAELEIGKLDPRRIVFLQKLADGKLKEKDFWYHLRMFFREIEQNVASAYQWRSIADDEATATAAMQALYTAGMLEQRKRDGQECSGCGIPLAAFELLAKEAGAELTECPNPDCGASFSPPQPTGAKYECPACHAGINEGQTTCSCGALIDFSMAEGTVATDTIAETEVVEELAPCWGSYAAYGVVPYGYFSPWNPLGDVVAFSVLCALWW